MDGGEGSGELNAVLTRAKPSPKLVFGQPKAGSLKGAELQSWDLKIPIRTSFLTICALTTPHVADGRTLRATGSQASR